MDSARMRFGGVLSSEAVEEKYLELTGELRSILPRRHRSSGAGAAKGCRKKLPPDTYCLLGWCGNRRKRKRRSYQGCSPPATAHSAIVESEEAKE